MTKKTIAIDIDDVLAQSAKVLIEFSNSNYNTSLSVDDYDEDWARLWGVSYDEMQKRVGHYFDSSRVLQYDHFEDAVNVLQGLKNNYKLVIITARSVKFTKEDTLIWLNKKFPNIFDDIHFAGIWDNDIDNNTVHITKGDICKNIGVDYLIDDQIKHCLGASENGVKCLLFGNYGWNRLSLSNNNITKVNTWSEVMEYFNEQV